MEILGIGIQEILFIMVLALIILGPRDIVKNGRKIGAWMRKLVLSDEWRVMRQTGDELRNLPNKLMRDANPDLNMDEVNREVFGDGYGTWSRRKPVPTGGQPAEPENSIAPPQSATEPEPIEAPIEDNDADEKDN